MKLSEIARVVKGSAYGRGDPAIRNILPPADAGREDLTFLFHPSTATNANVVIAARRVRGKSGIVVKDTKQAMYLLLKHLSKTKRKKEISSQSIIGKNVILAKSCFIEPFAIINDRAEIGKGSYIGAHCYIDDGVVIGKHCEIHPHTTVHSNTRIGDFVVVHSNTVVGKEGFGYVKKKRYHRIGHIGGVIIKKFVDIGGNVTIDRGTIGNTVIGEGTKIDNQVHIAHNVTIGRHCILMGQVGIAGSTRIGNNVTLCGQVGISDHLEIGDNVTVFAKSAVFKSIPKNKQYSGIPAREHSVVLNALARLYRGL